LAGTSCIDKGFVSLQGIETQGTAPPQIASKQKAPLN